MQETEEGIVRMPTVQQQAPDLASAHPVRGQASLPRAGLDEHYRSDVHQPLGSVGAVILIAILSFVRQFPHLHNHDNSPSLLFIFVVAASSGLQDGLFI